MHKNKFVFIFILFSLVFFSCNKHIKTIDKISSKNHSKILISPIQNQHMIEGSRLNVFIAGVTDNISNLKYSLQSPSPYVSITQKDAIATINIDAPIGLTRNLQLDIEITNGDKTSIQTFDVNIEKPKSTIYHCDPINGSDTGDGSKLKPWKNLSNILSSFVLEENSTILLYSGNHGDLSLSGNNHSPINIRASIGHHPIVNTIRFNNTSNWIISGLDIFSTQSNDELLHRNSYIYIDSSSYNITFRNNKIYSIEDSKNWQKQDWYEHCINGILVEGYNCIITNNYFSNTNFSIEISGDNNIVSYNIIDRYEGDAIRNTGNNNIFEYNQIQNAVVANYSDKNGNHDDAYQSWTFDKPIKNTIIRGNIVINCTDPNLPLRTKVLQGIVCFDGFVENWVIEDNLVIIDHPHGIALLGAKNCIIKNNKIIKNPYDFSQWESMPWILITNHKKGMKSQSNSIKNNIAAVITLNDTLGIMKNNVIFESANDYFIDYKKWDFRVRN